MNLAKKGYEAYSESQGGSDATGCDVYNIELRMRLMLGL
jgi:hypothetical protein